MSWLTQQINAQTRGVLRIPINEPGVPHVIDEPVTVRCSIEVEAGAEINVSSMIVALNGGSWIGYGGMYTINKSGGNSLFYMAGSELNLGGFVTNEAQSTGGYTFFLDTAQSLEHIRIGKVRTYQSMGLIADNSLSGIIVNMHLDDVMARMHRGRGSWLTRAFAYNSLRRCTVDYVGTNTNMPAWAFTNAEGLELDYVDMTGTAINGNTPSQWGFYFDNVRALTIKHAMADNAGGYGFYFNNCNWVDASIMKASLCGDIGIVNAGSHNLRMGNLYLSGRKGLAGDRAASLLWADPAANNFHADQLLAENYHTLHAGASQSKFTASKIVGA